MKMTSVNVRRIAGWYLASSAVGVLLLFPFREPLIATVPAFLHVPAWFLPMHTIIGIALWVLFVLVWKNRPTGVGGR